MIRRPHLLALLSAALVTLSHPFAVGGFQILGDAPNGLLAWIALVPLWIAVRDATPRNAFRIAWTFGSAMFLGSIYWVFIAMNTFGHINAPVSALLTVVLCVFLGLFPAVTVWVARWVGHRGALPSAAALPFAWAAVEWMRNYILTGFPWANIAYTQWKVLAIAQIADLTGLYGIVVLLVAVNVAIGELLVGAPDAVRRARVTVALLALALVYGLVRMPMVDAAVAGAPRLRVALVQGNISQDQKHASDFRDRVKAIYEEQIVTAEEHGADLIVLPEASLPYAVHVRSARIPDRSLGHRNRTHFLAGAASYWDEGEVRMAQNSALLVGPDKQIVARYHKSHLVPFGEYVPMKDVLFFVKKLTRAAGNFIPGRPEDIAPIKLPLEGGAQARLGILICYEDIFPEVSRIETSRGAEILVNMTNDAWYGKTSAPFQHVSMTVMRAIEARRSVVRSAQTGVSAFVDPSGRVHARTRIFEGPLTVHVEVPRGGPTSLYVRFGDVFAAAASGLVLAAALRALIRPASESRTLAAASGRWPAESGRI